MTPFFDRTTCNPFIYQMGYIEVMVEPLMTAWTDFLPISVRQEVMNKGLDENKKLIALKIEETKSLANIKGTDEQNNNSEDMDVDD